MKEDTGAHQAILVRVHRMLTEGNVRGMGIPRVWHLFLGCPTPPGCGTLGRFLGSRVCNYWFNISPSWEPWHPEGFIPMTELKCFWLWGLHLELIWQIPIRKECSEGILSFYWDSSLKEGKSVRVIPSPSSCLCKRKDKQQHFLDLWWQSTSSRLLNMLGWIKSREFESWWFSYVFNPSGWS